MSQPPNDFADYVAARRDRLVRSAVLLGCPAAEAEDLVQNALVRCLLSWGKVTAARDPDAYVHRVLINCFLKSRRRRWTSEIATADPQQGATITAHDASAVDSLVVQAALMRLPLPLREVLVLRYYADLSERQTAEALGIPAGTVKSRLASAVESFASDPQIRQLHIGVPDAESQ
jgi:RNA polymerase sigma-70 factor (sigma-E family)